MKARCTRLSSESSGWNVAAIDFSLPDDDGIVAFGGQHFDSRPHALDLGRADEDHLDRRLAQRFIDKSALTDGAVNLAPIGVAANANINRTQDPPASGSRLRWPAGWLPRRFQRWVCMRDELLQLLEASLTQQLEKCAGLAARDDQAVDLVQLLGLLDQHNFSAQLFEPLAVSVKIALQGQDTDFHADFRLIDQG